MGLSVLTQHGAEKACKGFGDLWDVKTINEGSLVCTIKPERMTWL